MELEKVEENNLKRYIELAESLQRLETNYDFKKLFLDFYIKEWVSERASLLATEYKNNRADVMEILISTANFQSFMNFIKNMGSTAREDIKLVEE